MFDFAKPEVSGLKNVLKMYFIFKEMNYAIDDIAPSQMDEFAQWYFTQRLGPPLIPHGRSEKMQSTAVTTTLTCRAMEGNGNITILHILFGLMAAEGISGKSPDIAALVRTFNKFPRISAEIRGM